jgi:hypothetical protein
MAYDLVLGDITAKVRDIISEPSPVRFTNAYMARAVSDACRQLSLDIDHPYQRYTFNVGSGQREWQLPALSKILRIYMQGPDGSQTLLIPTDLPTLNGEIQEAFDNTSGVINGAPTQSPQWQVQGQTTYPVQSPQIGGRNAMKNTWAVNISRPAYYIFAGYIGFVIPPMTTNPSTNAIVEAVIQHPEVVNPSDPILFPALAKMALVWNTVSQCWYSDNNSAAAEAMAKYEVEKGRLNDWQFSLQANRPKDLVPVTRGRGFSRRGWRW